MTVKEPHDSSSVPRTARERWLLRATGVALLVVAAIAIEGSITRPTGAAAGTRLEGPVNPLAVANTLRIGTFNIHGMVGTDGRRDDNRIANVISGQKLHFVALQEAHGRLFQSDPTMLGAALGMSHLFAPTERRWWRDDFGNGLLSAVPVENWQRIPLAGEDASGYRNVVFTRLKVGDSVVKILSTHIDRQAVHDEQLRTVISMFLSMEPPAILLGDLNTTADHSQLQRLFATKGVADATKRADGQIDWIFARGMDAVSTGSAPSDASDHALIWAELKPSAAKP